jgi:endonuclease G, mitochondrial
MRADRFTLFRRFVSIGVVAILTLLLPQRVPAYDHDFLAADAVAEHLRFGHPGGPGTLLDKRYFVLAHDDSLKIPRWVAYHLTRGHLRNANHNRTEDFRADPDLTEGDRAELADYRRSGYDRGHMAPADAFARSRTAMSATFVLSNMTPQRPRLNRGKWKQLEAEIRELARAHGEIWVVTGSLFVTREEVPLQRVRFIGRNHVAVPSHLYTAVLCAHGDDDFEMFGFIMPNALHGVSGPPSEFVRSIDDIERLSGLNLFSELPDELERRLERQIASLWPIE